MLGSGKVSLANYSQSPEDILMTMYMVKDNSVNVARKRAEEITATKGGNRYAMSSGRAEQLAEEEDYLDKVNTDVSVSYIRQACDMISNFTSPYKRKAAVGFFMSQGTSLRYPDDFKLRIDTDDMVKNADNETINNQISQFNDMMEKNLSEAQKNLDDFIDGMPKPVRDDYRVKYEGFFGLGNETGNIWRDIRREFNKHGLTLTEEYFDEYYNVVSKYREQCVLYNKPGYDMVADFFGIDKKSFVRSAQESLQPIVTFMPERFLTEVTDG